MTRPLPQLLPDHLARWAITSPRFADLARRAEGDLADALDELDASLTQVIDGGWGGLTVKATTPGGDLAIKLPADLTGTATWAEYAALQLLHRVGAAPPVGCTDRWLALAWVDAPALGVKRGAVEDVDGARLAQLVENVASVTSPFARRADILVARITVGAERAKLLAGYGIDVAVLDDVNTRLCHELADAGPQGFCHGDFDQANILCASPSWVTIDPQPRTGPWEAELGWLVGSMTYRSASHGSDVLRRWLCSAVGADETRTSLWENLYAASWLGEIAADFPTRRRDIAGLAKKARSWATRNNALCAM